MGCCKGSTTSSQTANENSISVTADKAPDGTTIGSDGSQGGTVPYYASPGGSSSNYNSGGPYTASGSEHATGTSYVPKKSGPVSSELGGLSQKYESNGNPAAIYHDINGTYSYGTYQINTGTGTMDNFLKYEQVNNPNAYNKLMASSNNGTLAGENSTEFQNTWKDLSSSDPNFANDQKGFIQSTHYDVAVNNIKNNTGLDINSRSLAVKDAVWSTAVQNGPNTSVLKNAFAGKNANTMSDAEIINAIYDERSRTTSSGSLVYFSKASTSVQNSVQNRLTNERQDALGMLK